MRYLQVNPWYGAPPSYQAAPSYPPAYPSGYYGPQYQPALPPPHLQAPPYPPPYHSGGPPGAAPASYGVVPSGYSYHQQYPPPGGGNSGPRLQHQATWGELSYNAVPPPTSLTAPPPYQYNHHNHFQQQQQQPQQQQKQGHPKKQGFAIKSNPMVSAANMSIANRPAYVSVASGARKDPSAAAQAAAAVAASLAAQHAKTPAPQNAGAPVTSNQWPPGLKSYVERCFKNVSQLQRANLQKALKIVIADAQNVGELWSRDWDTLPLPDLHSSPEEAAAIIRELGAVSGPQWTAVPTQPRALQRQFQQSHVYSAATSQPQPKQQLHPWPAIDTTPVTKGKKRKALDAKVSAEERRKQQRAGRFGDGLAPGAAPAVNVNKQRRKRLLELAQDNELDEELMWDAVAIKGTCQELEKSYFRLTSAPHPSTVRPEPVLRKALTRLTNLIVEEKKENGSVNYFYFLDQFKGLRQDLTVQHIKNDFAIAVYEAHARAALEYGDMAEYNQCQGQLAGLYGLGKNRQTTDEFLTYRILYQAVHARHGEGLQLLNTLKSVPKDQQQRPGYVQALDIFSALIARDSVRFFQFYLECHKLSRALLDLAVPRLRFETLSAFVSAFRPTVPVSFLSKALGFLGENDVVKAEYGRKKVLAGCSELIFKGKYAPLNDKKVAIKACAKWLEQCGAILENGAVDCKASAGHLSVPEDKEAVAHGDANLALDDFLKSFS